MHFILVSLLLLWKQESLPSFVVSSRPAQQGTKSSSGEQGCGRGGFG
jgi:hypothetical protein